MKHRKPEPHWSGAKPPAIDKSQIPKHVAVVMDGNGRWAKRRLLPRVAGHQQGVESVRAVISACLKKEIPCLTLFTFSSENWRRPEGEINFLFSIFLRSLRNEAQALHENNIRLKIIGDKTCFSEELQMAINDAEKLTEKNKLETQKEIKKLYIYIYI